MSNIARLIEEATDDQFLRGMTWYADARLELAKMHPDLTVSAGVTAAISPMNRWERNLLDAWNLLTAENPQDVKVSSFNRQKRKALAIMNGADPDEVLKGPKVRAFYTNFTNPDSDAVTVDRHAWNAYKNERVYISEKGPRIQGKLYEEAQLAYQRVAEEFGIRPYQAQAIAWVVWKEALGI